jgi:hypothetical protein
LPTVTADRSVVWACRCGSPERPRSNTSTFVLTSEEASDAISWNISTDEPPAAASDDSYSTYSRVELESSSSIDNSATPIRSPIPVSRYL